MPVIILLAAMLVFMLLFVALMPLMLVLRYRAGTARRPARGWLAAINTAGVASSAAFFLFVAAVTNAWVPKTFVYVLVGLTAGCLLGLLGLWSSRWETSRDSLHYTPNRWLVLTIMLVVVSRIAYGLWRAWHTWPFASGETSWLVAVGVAGSMAAGAVVLGYYLMFWAGVWRRARRHGRNVAWQWRT